MAVYKRDIEEIKRLRRNAGRKVKRLEASGIMSMLVDPRKPVGAEKSMTRKQLNAYKRELRDFTSRSNQYVRGAAGNPIRASVWRDFVRARDEANKAMARYNSRFSGLPSNHGMSVHEYMAMTRPVHPELSDPITQSYYWPNNSKPTSFASNKAVREATKAMRKRADPMFLERTARKNRRTAYKMIDELGDRNLRKRIKALSLDQFDMLWRFTTFTSALALKYEHLVKKLTGNSSIMDFAGRDIDSQLSFVEGLTIDKQKGR